jgi:uncharacterized protein
VKCIFIIFLALCSVAWCDENLRLIQVSGTAEKYVDPNMVIVSVETFGRSEHAKAAQEKQALEFQRVKKVIEKFKIKKEDFLTENINLTPEYKYDEKSQTNKTIGFRVSHQIKVILRLKEDIGSLLDALSSNAKIESSGLSIQSIAWDNDKRKSYSEDLIQEAVKDGQQKAERLALASGVKIAGVQTIHYSESNSVVFPEASFKRSSAMMDSRTGTELGNSSIKIRTDVSLQYRIQ